ncbi:MAG: fatty acid desaturase, partial [Acidobacteria bacterium]|nr:fatty acid desaturase [Acidobacteriota bacterium]
QLSLLILLPWLLYYADQPWQWVPLSILLGFVVFSFSVLLHEVVHKVVFEKDRPGLNYLLGFFYGAISGLSATQFSRWHLDHHRELGDAEADPKRFYLSPKQNKRWLKVLYATPWLFFKYFRAAARAARTYEPELRRRIQIERLVVITLHLTVLFVFMKIDPLWAIRAYVIPIFFVFPFAFTLNRLGQHYIIDPENPAAWSTLMRPNFIWNWLFLWSSYHLEHHYLPGVPMYRLRPLNNALMPFYQSQGIRAFSYGELIKLWIAKNHAPHTKPT